MLRVGVPDGWPPRALSAPREGNPSRTDVHARGMLRLRRLTSASLAATAWRAGEPRAAACDVVHIRPRLQAFDVRRALELPVDDQDPHRHT